MKKLTHLKNVYQLDGFTLGNEYKMLDNTMNAVSVQNDFGNTVTFTKVEGANDFKNHFYMV